jgi:hypothetical protein
VTDPKDNSSGTEYAKQQGNRRLEIAAVVIASIAALASAAAIVVVSTWQAWIMSDTAKRQLRAYIGISPGGIEHFGDEQLQTFALMRKNYGVTPAYDIIASPALVEVKQIGAPLNSPWDTKNHPPNREMVTLFPTMELPLYVTGAKGITSPIIASKL